MSKVRLVITAVVLEKRPVTEVAAACGVSRSWIYELVARYRTEGDAAFEPRSRRPLTRPDATPTARADLVVEVRRPTTSPPSLTATQRPRYRSTSSHLMTRAYLSSAEPTGAAVQNAPLVVPPFPLLGAVKVLLAPGSHASAVSG